jgi:hypothetical protein
MILCEFARASDALKSDSAIAISGSHVTREIEQCERIHLSAGEAQSIVAEAARRYFDSRRARVDGFIDRHFSLLGSLALHRKALGWDLLKAPANIALAVPYFSAQLTARIAGRLGAKRLSRYLAARPILFKTAVAREIEWLLMTELFELPFRQGRQSTRKDALAEAVLASPSVQSALTEVLGSFGLLASDLQFRDSLERMIATYTETRTAASEITTTMISMATGAAVLKQITPGAMVLGPALASTIAYDAAVASFPFGQTLGGLWYTLFPVATSPALMLGTTAGLMTGSAVLAAFSGVVTDPAQRILGLHRRRLLRLIDALERQFNGDSGGFLVRDHYVARLLTLFELLSGAFRLAKP